MNKKVLFILLFTILAITADAQYPLRYFVAFTDKDNNGYTLSNPSAFLSTRAIARRTNQNIPYDFHDLPVTQAYVDSVAAHGATVLTITKWFNGVTIETTDVNILNSILALPFVVNSVNPIGRKQNPNGGKTTLPPGFIERESMLHTNASFAPERQQSPQAIDYGYAFNQIHMIGGDYLHSQGYMGEGKVIAMLDAGFLHADTLSGFDSIRNNNQILGTRNFVSTLSNNVYADHWHGCMCLSCIGANWPGHTVGTAPHASFWLIVTEDAATENIVEEYNWASGAEFADSVGADIISTSLGYNTFDGNHNDHAYADMNGRTTPGAKAATIAAEKGILVIAANGNEGQSSWHFLDTPADADSILAVGAVNAAANYAAFSSKGPASDGRIKPDVADQGAGTTVIDPNNTTTSLNTSANGTSFATPILAGAAACLWQANPTMTNMQIRQAIIQSASQYTHPDSLLGYGIPNFAFANSILTKIPLPDRHQSTLMDLYPNPFSTSISFDLYSDTSQQIEISLKDAIGKMVITHTYQIDGVSINKFNILESDYLAKGIYILEIRSINFLFTRKIVKI